MKIILVRPNWGLRWLIMPPLGLGYIAAAAKKAGHECKIYDAWLKDDTPLEAAQAVSEFAWDIVGVQVFSDTVDWARDFIAFMRHDNPDARYIIGGPYVTVMGRLARTETGADIGIQGEFDTLTNADLETILKSSYPGMAEMTRADVNAIPIPDYDAMPLPAYWPYLYQVSSPTRGKRIGVIQRSRGCPFHCTFCASGATSGHVVRIRDDDNVIHEIEYLRARWGIDEVWFQDDNAIVNYERGIELFARLAPLRLHIRLPAGVRWENVDDKMAAEMRRAGVYFTGIGIESGHPRVLRRIKKSADREGLRNAIRILDAHGIITIGFFIFGLPTETRSEMETTVEFALSTRLHHAQFGTFISYPGAEDFGKTSLLTQAELVKIQRNATLRFYFRPRVIWNFIHNFQWMQIKAIWNHPWIVQWRKR